MHRKSIYFKDLRRCLQYILPVPGHTLIRNIRKISVYNGLLLAINLLPVLWAEEAEEFLPAWWTDPVLLVREKEKCMLAVGLVCSCLIAELSATSCCCR